MDSLQRTSDEYAYNAWGEEFAHLRNDAGAPKNPFRYVGKSGYYSDDDTGLDLLGVRCYDPLIGRFITPDPSRDGLNWYAYADNNPANMIDPTGEMSEFAERVAGLAEHIPILGGQAKANGNAWGNVDSGNGNATFAAIGTFPLVTDIAFTAVGTVELASGIGGAVTTVRGIAKQLRNVKPMQIHHFLTNKSLKYTRQIRDIIEKYGLDLDGEWNKAVMRHQGRHPNAYHEYMINAIRRIDAAAKGNVDQFLKEFRSITKAVRNRSEMLTKKYWK